MKKELNWRAIVAFWIAMGLLNTVRQRLTLYDHVPNFDIFVALQWAMPDALMWIPLTPLPLMMARRFPVQVPHRVRDASVHLLMATAVAGLHVILDVGQNMMFGALEGRPKDFGDTFSNIAPYTTHVNALIYFMIVAFRRYLDAREQSAQLQRRLAEARLQSLQARLRPHFLFNALHTSSALVKRDPDAARAVLQGIGDLLRHSLDLDGRLEITLQEEIEVAKTYLEVEQRRFDDRLVTSIEVSDDVRSAAVPPFLIQPLVENAVQHGIESQSRPGRIRVTATQSDGTLRIVVEDDGSGPPPDQVDGVGLATTRSRLEEMYGSAARLDLEPRETGGTRVSVRLPLRRLELPREEIPCAS